MLWRDINRELAGKLGGHPTLAKERPFIYIDSGKQTLHWINIDELENKSFSISTAANGLGNRLDSYKTPSGIHRIKQKIGDGAPPGMIFEAREASGRICKNTDNREKDEITSRIMWLDGLEPGLNKDGVNDSFSRYIYIHGTSDERRIGEPVSHGCIRMANKDVIELFDAVLVNDLVLIR
ncbi:MAG: L,D-transpeptidase [Gammaproteobacteria bacterium]|nr:MAG: L,D-transpeptidase [Gammaproteobacteria bacterium]